jgi:hypothetical protein
MGALRSFATPLLDDRVRQDYAPQVNRADTVGGSRHARGEQPDLRGHGVGNSSGAGSDLAADEGGRGGGQGACGETGNPN